MDLANPTLKEGWMKLIKEIRYVDSQVML